MTWDETEDRECLKDYFRDLYWNDSEVSQERKKLKKKVKIALKIIENCWD